MSERQDIPTGLPFGQNQELEEAQSLVGAVPDEDVGLYDAPPGPSINRPSDSPNESLFEGSRIGPGAGPEALSYPETEPSQEALVAESIVPILEAIVSERRDASVTSRQMVRKYRSELPVREQGAR